MSPANPTPPALPPGLSAVDPKKSPLNGCLIAAIIGVVLLIGISVAAIVAALAFPAYSGIQKKMKLEQARTLAMTLVNSCKGYHAEYAKYPLPSDGTAGEVSPLRTDEVLTGTLLGRTAEENPKKIQFLPDLKPVQRGGGFGLLSEGETVMVVDPWNEAFYVLMDVNDDGEIPNPDSRPGAPPVLYQGVIVWSAGPDKDPSTWNDNVMSWESFKRLPTSPSTPAAPVAPPPSPAPAR